MDILVFILQILRFSSQYYNLILQISDYVVFLTVALILHLLVYVTLLLQLY